MLAYQFVLSISVRWRAYLNCIKILLTDLLVAQSIVENMPLVSKDQFFSKYGISVIW